VQAQRRAEVEKEQRENAAYHERAAKEQEERLNREERERFAAQAHKQRDRPHGSSRRADIGGFGPPGG
jgi:hypothetical protein